MRRLSPLVPSLVLLLAACAKGPALESDWERNNRDRLSQGEAEVAALPPYPKSENLVQFYVSAATDFKYFIDGSTLTVQPRQKIVRYVLVARSRNGVDNVSYEAIHCPEEYRVLAVGQGDSWDSRPGEWRAITKGSSLSWPYALARNYFCPHRDAIRTTEEGIDALRRGGHPAVSVEQRNLGY